MQSFFFSQRAQIFTCEDLVALIPKRKWLVSRECARAVWEHKHKMFKTMLNRKIFCDKSWSSQLAAATCFTLLFFCVHVKLKRDSFYSCKQFHTLADGEKKTGNVWNRFKAHFIWTTYISTSKNGFNGIVVISMLRYTIFAFICSQDFVSWCNYAGTQHKGFQFSLYVFSLWWRKTCIEYEIQ